MPRQQRDKSNTGFYHVMIRGNERKNLFLDDQDRLYFMGILKTKKEDNRYKLHAFCIMDNHVHLLLQECEEDIANIMKRINISYVFYFNKKYQRIGHLFQDRYRSEKIEQDSYLLAVVRYIHRNPLKAGIVENMETYTWNSYREYALESIGHEKPVETELILGIFSENRDEARKEFIQFMDEEEPERFLEINEKIGIMPENCGKN